MTTVKTRLAEALRVAISHIEPSSDAAKAADVEARRALAQYDCEKAEKEQAKEQARAERERLSKLCRICKEKPRMQYGDTCSDRDCIPF